MITSLLCANVPSVMLVRPPFDSMVLPASLPVGRPLILCAP
jgi:hypothetical protein